MFKDAGFSFDKGRAPLLQLKENSKFSDEERRLTLDHVEEKRDRWDLALHAHNLRFELQNANSMRETIQQRDKALRDFAPQSGWIERRSGMSDAQSIQFVTAQREELQERS